MNKLHRDCVGSSLVEFTLVFPVLLVVLLGSVDVGFMLFEWMLANKAAYVGAHRAIVSDPVAIGINQPDYTSIRHWLASLVEILTQAQLPVTVRLCSPPSAQRTKTLVD